jgi:mono/diheme cytochrome c family protein
MKGEGLIGPALQGNSTLANPQQLATLLANGKGKMPPVGKGWTPKELASLTAYLKQEFTGGG